MSYYDVYLSRINRDGVDLQSRVQGQREREFENYLNKTVYQVTFKYNNYKQRASLEPYKDDETQTLGYLLTKVGLNLPNGTILTIKDKNKQNVQWMIWWLEAMQASGYNRYIVLRLSTEFTFQVNGTSQTQMGFIKGPGKSAIMDTVKSQAGKTLYTENDYLYLFMTSMNSNIKKGTYLTTTVNSIVQAFEVTEVDYVSTPGVMYISMDPVVERDLTPAPTQGPTDPDEDFYWLKGGN